VRNNPSLKTFYPFILFSPFFLISFFLVAFGYFFGFYRYQFPISHSIGCCF